MAPKPNAEIDGVPFYVDTHQFNVGRRQPAHALPFQDKGVAFADLGRAPRKGSITAILIGDDHAAQRDKLIKVLEKTGAKTLKHPTFGRMLVTLGSDTLISESTGELRATRVSFRFTETYDQPPQTPALDTASAVKAAAKAGRKAAGKSFSKPSTGLKTLVSDIVAAANSNVLTEVLGDMRDLNGQIGAVLAAPGAIAAQIDAISRELDSLMNTPQKLFDSIDGALELIANAVKRIVGPDGEDVDAADADAASSALRRGRNLQRSIAPMAALGSNVPTVPDIDTQDRHDERAGQRAVQRHMRASGLFNLADSAADTPFDSAEDALNVRDALSAALADLADSEPDLDAPLADALKHTAALVALHLTRVAGPLPTVAEYTPAQTLPTEVIAYLLYGDPERAEEIALRNPSIKHPGLVRGKVALEVASL